MTAVADNDRGVSGIKTYGRGEHVFIENGGSLDILREDITRHDGIRVRSISGKDLSGSTPQIWLGRGMFFVKAVTNGGTATTKIATGHN